VLWWGKSGQLSLRDVKFGSRRGAIHGQRRGAVLTGWQVQQGGLNSYAGVRGGRVLRGGEEVGVCGFYFLW